MVNQCGLKLIYRADTVAMCQFDLSVRSKKGKWEYLAQGDISCYLELFTNPLEKLKCEKPSSALFLFSSGVMISSELVKSSQTPTSRCSEGEQNSVDAFKILI